MIKIEFSEPETHTCECCGGNVTKLTRFVYQDDCAFAAYYVTFTDGHDEKIVYSLVGLGEWGEEGSPDRRRAFSLKLRTNEDNYQVSITDRYESPWKDVEILGRILDREEALNDPWIKDVFHITDHMVMEDEPLIAFLND